MKLNILAHSLRVIFTGGMVVSIGALANTAHAEDQPEEKVERVIVTGSNIKRSKDEKASMVQVLTRKDIEQSGKTSVADVVRGLSADNNGSISSAFSSGFAGSASGVSLRGLSVNATLVLINGRRTAPYGFGDDGQRSFVDLNSIPLDAVDRIDVVKDGASALYGSDAMAGVVNVILRQNYQGKTISASVGDSGQGDGVTKHLSGTFGFGDIDVDKYNFFFNVDAKTSAKINQSDRDGYLGQADGRPWGGTDQRAGWTTSSGGGGNSFVGTVRPVTAAGGPAGPVQNLPGCKPGNLDLNTSINSGGGCLWDPVQFAQVQPETQSINLFGRGSFKITDNSEAYVELGVNNNKASTQTTPSALNGAGFDLVGQRVVNNGSGPDQLLLPIGHPDNPFSDAAVRPRWVDPSRPRTSDLETTVSRALAGVKGTEFGWDYDSAVLYAESRTDRTQRGYYLKSALAAAAADGSLRIGDNAHLMTPATIGFISPDFKNSAVTKLASIDFKVNRQFGMLPGGPIGVALGTEYRYESTYEQPTPFTETAGVVGLGYAAARSSHNVGALYAEVNLPVLKSLSFDLALRTDQYSDVGNSTTPKASFTFTPIPEIGFRGSYSEGFRAPGPAENGNSATSGYTSYSVDPVRCNVTGLDTDCKTGKQIGAVTIGNPGLKPETSKSYSIGVVLEPIKNISATIDYWRIVRKNEITGADPLAIIADPAAYPNAHITRGEATTDFPNLPGAILLVDAPYVNAGKTETNGIDVDIRGKYNFNGVDKLNTGLTYTQMFSFKRTVGDVTSNYVGTHGPTSLSGNGGTPRIRASYNLGWDHGPFNLTGTINYVSGLQDREEIGGDCLDVDPVSGEDIMSCRVKAFTTVDLYSRYKISPKWEVSATVSNLFDTRAPLDVQTYGGLNYNPSLHQTGAIGRYFLLGTRYTF